MAIYPADLNAVGFQYESGTYATPTGTTLQWVGLVQNHTVDESMGVIVKRFLGNNSRNVGQFINGPQDFTGVFSFHPQDWKFMNFALGSCVDAGSPSPYTHVISELAASAINSHTSGADNPFISFTLEDSQRVAGTGQNFNRTLRGCVVNSLSIAGEMGAPLTVEVNYVAQTGSFTSGAPSSLTATTTRPFMFSDCLLHIPSGTTYTRLKTFNMTVNNNLVSNHYIAGSRVIPRAPLVTMRDYTFTATLDSDHTRAKTLYESYLLGGSTFNILFDVTDAGAGAGSRDAYFVFSGCKLMDMEAPSPVEDLNEHTLIIRPQDCVVNVDDTIQLYNAW